MNILARDTFAAIDNAANQDLKGEALPFACSYLSLGAVVTRDLILRGNLKKIQ